MASLLQVGRSDDTASDSHIRARGEASAYADDYVEEELGANPDDYFEDRNSATLRHSVDNFLAAQNATNSFHYPSPSDGYMSAGNEEGLDLVSPMLLQEDATLHSGLDPAALLAGEFTLVMGRELGRGAFGVVHEGTLWIRHVSLSPDSTLAPCLNSKNYNKNWLCCTCARKRKYGACTHTYIHLRES